LEPIQLKVLGRFPGEYFEKFSGVLYPVKPASEIILFCDYSSFEIPIGFSFNEVEDADKNKFSGIIVLKTVTQASALHFDGVPIGHKTICKFDVNEPALFNVLDKMKMIKSWYGSDEFLIFRRVDRDQESLASYPPTALKTYKVKLDGSE
jgi:hypothetical protein